MSWVAAIPLLGKLVERLIPDPDQAAKAKNQLVDMAVRGELDELAQRAGVIKAEAQGDGWLQLTAFLASHCDAGVYRPDCCSLARLVGTGLVRGG